MIVLIESPYFLRPDACRYLACCLLHCYMRGEIPYASHALGPLALPEYVEVEIPSYNASTSRIVVGRDLGLTKAAELKASLHRADVPFVVALYQDMGISQGMADAQLEADRLGYPLSLRSLTGRALHIWAEGSWPSQARLAPNHTMLDTSQQKEPIG